MDFLTKFPQFDDAFLRELNKAIDSGFRDFTRAYGGAIESFFDPLRVFLIYAEQFMLRTPWIVIFLLIVAIAWVASRSWRITLLTGVILAVIGIFGMWEDTMKTISMIFVCTVISIAVGIPLGIAMARWNRMQAIVNPIAIR